MKRWTGEEEKNKQNNHNAVMQKVSVDPATGLFREVVSEVTQPKTLSNPRWA